MSKRASKAQAALVVWALIIGVPIYAASKIFETTGWIAPVLVIVAIVLIVAVVNYDKKQKRLAYLRAKYHDEDVVEKIYNGYFWQGQTEEQLRDSLGAPIAIDNKLLKTKTREVWKYRQQGVNRFALRITVENGYVAGWDQKS